MSLMVVVPILDLTWLTFLSKISHGLCHYLKSPMVDVHILNLTWLVFLS